MNTTTLKSQIRAENKLMLNVAIGLLDIFSTMIFKAHFSKKGDIQKVASIVTLREE